MCLPPLVWQTFDVEFTNAIVKDGRKIKNAVITVRQNGVVIHNKFEIPGRSKYGVRGGPQGVPGPFMLQNHREPLQFRNIWVLPHGPTPALPVSKPSKPKPAMKPVAPATAAAKAMLGKWHIRFSNNGNKYVLNLKVDGTSHLARTGKAWDGVWGIKDGMLTVTNPHDIIRIKLMLKDGVYAGKNNFGLARLSRNEVSKF